MLGTSELLEKCFLLFLFIFPFQRAGAVAAGGRGGGGRRPGTAGDRGMLAGTQKGPAGRSLASFWSLALPQPGAEYFSGGKVAAAAWLGGGWMSVPGDPL